jgi:Heparinase II/III N-terminus/Heparinase II/III-like protein
MSRKVDTYERNRIERITEPDFWGSISRASAPLRDAVGLGLGKRKSAAYLALARLHRDCFSAEMDHVTSLARERNSRPEQRRASWSKADDVRNGDINGWHETTLKLGREIDFNANFGRSGQYGFHYLNWLTPLIDRYLLEREAADLERITEIVSQYYHQRTCIRRRIPRIHPVYYELGATAKTRVLLPAYLAAINVERPDWKLTEAFLKLFLGFGRALDREQQSGYRPGNWQIVGSSTLFRLGAVFSQFREAHAWRRRGTAMMLAHLRRDFYPDGGHRERCWGYGWMSLRGVLDFYEVGRRTAFLGARNRRFCLRAVRKAFRWLLKTETPAGVMPAYGDGDLFSGSAIRSAATGYLPGAEATARSGKSLCLRPSGYAVMRDDDSPGARYLNVNFGESGGGHTHNDLLDFNLWAFGRPLLEEVARFESYDNPLDNFFRSPQAHNQVVVDGFPMDRAHCRGTNLLWKTHPRFDFFSASHSAFLDHPLRKNPLVRITRQILFVRGEYFLICDTVEPLKGENIFTLSSWLHSPTAFKLLGPGLARTSGRSGCLVAFACPDELRRLETGTDVAPEEAGNSRLYPARYHLRARKWAPIGYTGTQRFAMLLWPFQGRVPQVSLRLAEPKSPGGNNLILEAHTPAGRDQMVFRPGSARDHVTFIRRGKAFTIC